VADRSGRRYQLQHQITECAVDRQGLSFYARTTRDEGGVNATSDCGDDEIVVGTAWLPAGSEISRLDQMSVREESRRRTKPLANFRRRERERCEPASRKLQHSSSVFNRRKLRSSLFPNCNSLFAWKKSLFTFLGNSHASACPVASIPARLEAKPPNFAKIPVEFPDNREFRRRPVRI
jgi:hypothetical protein